MIWPRPSGRKFCTRSRMFGRVALGLGCLALPIAARGVTLPSSSAPLVGPAPARPAQRQATDASFEIVPGTRFGPIREATTRVALSSMFPPASIQDREVYIGEGFCTDGTLVFPGTANEIHVAWQDAARAQVAFVRTTMPNGRWGTSRGVRVGSLLPDLERLSGKVMTFSGFGWDYGGGLLWSEPTGSVGLRLEIDPADAEKGHAAPDSREIFGDKEVRSDHPLVRTLRVRVGEIIQSWGAHFGEKDCG